jgi:hypothetical protein
MIQIISNDKFINEKKYILSIIFTEFLGIKWSLVTKKYCEDFQIRIHDVEDFITMPDIFFKLLSKWYFKKQSLPKSNLPQWDSHELSTKIKLVSRNLPVIFGQNKKDKTSKIYLPIDIIGSCFFMLTRYEENVIKSFDKHNRFSAFSSYSHKEGFIDRPIVDEYVEVLWIALKKIYPKIVRKKNEYKLLVSCDVDTPYENYVNNIFTMSKNVLGDFIKRKNIKQGLNKIQNYWCSKTGNYKYDKYDKFKWMMNINEKKGNKLTFYFIVNRNLKLIDGNYNVFEPRVLELIKEIKSRGHKIGMHASYNSYNDFTLFKKETEIFKKLTKDIYVDKYLVRQHYLRWSIETPIIQNQFGFNNDSSVGYADYVGFRSGTSHEYSMFDFSSKTKLDIKQNPLIFMEGSLLDPNYMNLNLLEARDHINKIYKRIKLYNGKFTLLWHNSNLISDHEKEFYANCISKFSS